MWEENRKTGLGIILFTEAARKGDFYKGELQDDRIEGFGTYYTASAQELYVGQF